MRRRRQLPPNIRFAGTHFSDPFLEWLKGFNRRKRAIRDVTRLSNEVLNYRHELFPVRSIPIPDRPGRVTLNRDFFKVQFSSGRINKDLTEFFSEDGYQQETVSFRGGHDLGEFFELAFHELLVNGIDTYAVEWEKVKLGNRYYTLPVAFHWVNPATIHINEYDDKKYLVQKFSFISKFIASYYEYHNNVFSKDESLIFKYPDPNSPVSASLKYLNKLSQGMDFSLTQGKANIEPENYSLELEKTRYRSAQEYWRQENMTRIKVRRIFNQPIGGYGISITTYYEAFAYAEYKKHLNTMRDYFTSQFNEQVMGPLQVRNGFATSLQMRYQGFVSNELIDETFLQYSRREISVDEFVTKIKDNYDTNLF